MSGTNTDVQFARHLRGAKGFALGEQEQDVVLALCEMKGLRCAGQAVWGGRGFQGEMNIGPTARVGIEAQLSAQGADVRLSQEQADANEQPDQVKILLT